MKKLDNIRLAKSALNDTIYIGVLNKNGDTWIDKKDITDDFLRAVIARWNGFEETITSTIDKKEYKISIKETGVHI